MYNKTLVILLSGKAGVGKSFFAKQFKELFKIKGLNVAVCSLALGIKEIAYKYMGWDGNKDEKGRKLLQTLGTDVGRAYNPDCWVNYLLYHLENSSDFPYDVIIIDDWRFPNEHDVFAESILYNPVKIRMHSATSLSYLTHECENHISENALPEDDSYYNYIIVNDFKEPSAKQISERLVNTLDSQQSKYKGE